MEKLREEELVKKQIELRNSEHMKVPKKDKFTIRPRVEETSVAKVQEVQSVPTEKVVQVAPKEEDVVSLPPNMINYVRDVQKKIVANIEYPEQAYELGWQGVVKLRMLLLRDGSLVYASIRESSGYDILDDTALKTAVNIAAPYEPFPSESHLREVDITIPIVFSLD